MAGGVAAAGRWPAERSLQPLAAGRAPLRFLRGAALRRSDAGCAGAGPAGYGGREAGRGGRALLPRLSLGDVGGGGGGGRRPLAGGRGPLAPGEAFPATLLFPSPGHPSA
ncbi:MAG TPA: hypothetical protein ENK56_08040 [Chloroflexi bacterium]|nr:hypothetical protein [Chloroflexota bacterium]